MFKNLQYKLAWVIIALIICVIGGTLLFLQQLYLPAAFLRSIDHRMLHFAGSYLPLQHS